MTQQLLSQVLNFLDYELWVLEQTLLIQGSHCTQLRSVQKINAVITENTFSGQKYNDSIVLPLKPLYDDIWMQLDTIILLVTMCLYLYHLCQRHGKVVVSWLLLICWWHCIYYLSKRGTKSMLPVLIETHRALCLLLVWPGPKGLTLHRIN